LRNVVDSCDKHQTGLPIIILITNGIDNIYGAIRPTLIACRVLL